MALLMPGSVNEKKEFERNKKRNSFTEKKPRLKDKDTLQPLNFSRDARRKET